ncbi:MAG: DMT family transporter [Rhodospirillaceae bacterium]|nr:DMT family transporter [Rhodospirillales bacterium]
MPAVFVVLWSTGFIGAKFGLPYAEPFTFLSLRFVAVIALLGGVAVVMRAPWPNDRRLVGHLAVSGLLVHGLYLGGVFAAIRDGLPSGLTALVVGLQPLLTAVVTGRLLGEVVSRRQWGGLALGLAGVAMVLSTRLTGLEWGTLPWRALGFALVALLGMTAGTLYQKRFCTGMDLRTGAVLQYVAAALVMLPLAALTETMRVEWTGSFIFALGWLVLVLSVGAISLLMMLIRQGEAARVASLFYLVPPVTALMAWALFDERLSAVGLAGMVLAAAGVALVVSRR